MNRKRIGATVAVSVLGAVGIGMAGGTPAYGDDPLGPIVGWVYTSVRC
ncbi:hypothetical protein AB0M46_45295 [Dactylosporangium sp. NPDC051485]